MTIDEIKRIAATVYEAEAVEAKARREAGDRRHELRTALGEHLGIIKAELGGWECQTSPTGQCVYNLDKDPAMDNCVFCGDPDERK